MRRSHRDLVADAVKQDYDGVNGKVTYVSYGAARIRGLPVAAMLNGGGAFVPPDDDHVTVGLSYATPDPFAVGTLRLAHAANDPDAYFPATVSYALAPTEGADPGKSQTLAEFLCYAITDGQEPMYRLGYDSFSPPLTEIARRQIGRIPGASGACAGALPPVVAEAPAAALLALAAAGALGLGLGVRTGRRRSSLF